MRPDPDAPPPPKIFASPPNALTADPPTDSGSFDPMPRRFRSFDLAAIAIMSPSIPMKLLRIDLVKPLKSFSPPLMKSPNALDRLSTAETTG